MAGGGDQQDILSASRHGSTGSRPDISGTPRDSTFQGSTNSIGCDLEYTSPDFHLDQFWYQFLEGDSGTGVCDADIDGSGIQTCSNGNQEKPEDDDQKPRKGMTFPSVTEAEEFYKSYAKKTGFTVRRGKIYKQPDGTLKWRRFLCSCEGFRVKKRSNYQGKKFQRLETRTGCRAWMEVRLEKKQWVITNLRLDHNHSFNNSNQSSETGNEPSDKAESKDDLPQETEEDSASSSSESLEAKPSDEVEAPCNHEQNASDLLTMEERQLLVAESADSESALPYLPNIFSDQAPTMNNENQLSEASTSSSIVRTPTLPIATITSASVPATGSSHPQTSCLQDKPLGDLRDKGKQCSSSGRVNTSAQVEGSESIWQQILKKYGDITAKCALKSPFFMAFVKESVLKIVELLQNNTVRELSAENISTMGHILSDLEHVEVKVDWLRTRFEAVRRLSEFLAAKDIRDSKIQWHLTQLKGLLYQAETSLQELQHPAPPGWLSINGTLGKGLLQEETD